MERMLEIRRNLVYPDRLELDALMKGPRAPGKEGGWTGVAPSPSVDPNAEIPLYEWVNGRRCEPGLRGNTSSDGEPTFSQNNIEDPESEFERRNEAKKKLRVVFQRIADRIALSPLVLEVPNASEGNGASPRFVERNAAPKVNPQSTPPKKTPPFPPKWDHDLCKRVIDPHGTFYFMWLFCVSLCYIYNLVVIPLRASFPYQTPKNTPIWLSFDALCDFFYIIDLIIIKPKVSYIEEGSWVREPKKTKQNYRQKFLFKMDLLSLLPLEIFYLYFGTSAVLLRIPRLCKAQTFSQFYSSVDKMLSSPLIIRVARTLIYTFYLIHLNACSYYKVSSLEGIGTNGWVYNGEGNAYIRCFYFATKTSTSIGKNAKPENDLEYIYMTFAWLMGVCVFALLVGQIRYFIITGTKSQTEYRKLLAETLKCMRQLNIPCDLQKRVMSWFEFTWKQQRTLDDSSALNALPVNLKTEVAINMHIETLKKVKLFTDCDQALLRDLVLKLRSVIYLPGDIICRKGDVGREMYIVKRGDVEVIGGLNNNEVIATLSEGSVFGEISLLNIKGINRRTADVRSHLFSNIFVLSKVDFNSVLIHYPEAQELLLKRAKDLMNINAARDRAAQEVSSEDTTNEPHFISDQLTPEPPLPEQPPSQGEDEVSLESLDLPSPDIDKELEESTPSCSTSGSSNSDDSKNSETKTTTDPSKCYCEKVRRRGVSKNNKSKKNYNLYRTASSPKGSKPSTSKSCSVEKRDKQE